MLQSEICPAYLYCFQLKRRTVFSLRRLLAQNTVFPTGLFSAERKIPLQMRRFQRLTQCKRKRNSHNNRNCTVCQRRSRFRDHHRPYGRKIVLFDPILHHKSFGKVKHNVRQLTRDTRNHIPAKIFALLFACVRNNSADKSHQELEDKRDVKLRRINRVGQVKHRRPNSGRQSAADTAEQKAGKQTENVAEMNPGPRVAANRNTDLQLIAHHAQRRHQTDKANEYYFIFLVFLIHYKFSSLYEPESTVHFPGIPHRKPAALGCMIYCRTKSTEFFLKPLCFSNSVLQSYQMTVPFKIHSFHYFHQDSLFPCHIC